MIINNRDLKIEPVYLGAHNDYDSTTGPENY